MRVLTVNAGSSSLKLSLLDGEELVESAELEATGGQADATELRDFLARVHGTDAVAHRVVHGGTKFTTAVVVDEEVREALERLADLAPLHQPTSLAALDTVRGALPDVPAVACFDTAFFADLPAAAATVALPRAWRERYALRRFGFHGLSHAWASRRGAELVSGRHTAARVVVAHLGSGCSLSAVRGGRALDTTMSFTPLDGLVMATRSGAVDPGLLLWLEEHEGLSPHEVADTLEHRSGLTGLCGTGDMREVLRRVAAGEEEATLALDHYVYRVVTGVGAMVAAAGGLDALVFTGGVGERAAEVRRRVAEGLGFLGVRIDRGLNAAVGDTDAEVGSGAGPAVLVVAAREDLEMARQATSLLGR